MPYSAEERKNFFQGHIDENSSFLQNIETAGQEGLWLFGYGSLVWKANFHYTKSRVGWIHGYVRRFWQESIDHRGVPEYPGRVATLVPTNNREVWGVAYYIPPEHLEESLKTLNFREKGGYSLTLVDFYQKQDLNESSTECEVSPENSPIKVVLYIANENNANFAGAENLDSIADRIGRAVGPSGTNAEYLLKLVDNLTKLNAVTDDDRNHTLLLARKVREKISSR